MFTTFGALAVRSLNIFVQMSFAQDLGGSMFMTFGTCDVRSVNYFVQTSFLLKTAFNYCQNHFWLSKSASSCSSGIESSIQCIIFDFYSDTCFQGGVRPTPETTTTTIHPSLSSRVLSRRDNISRSLPLTLIITIIFENGGGP